MNLLTVSTDLISIFLFTTLFLFFARKVAKKVGLVDKPNFRKRHQGLIPLVGGISVYAGICFTFGIVDYYIPHASLYLACAGVLVFIGALDDRFDISVKIRATIQAAVGIVMMVFGKLYLSSLGYIFGSWEMVLGPFGYFLTLFAVWAAINAFNMVDGIDGLLGGLSCVSFAAIGMILWFDGQTSLASGASQPERQRAGQSHSGACEKCHSDRSPGVFTVCLADEPRLADFDRLRRHSGRSAFAGETGAGDARYH